LGADDLGAAATFFALADVTLTCFWEVFFWFDFGDLSPMILFFFRGLTHLRHFIFSGGNCRMLDGVMIVNGGHQFIRQQYRKRGGNNGGVLHRTRLFLWQAGSVNLRPWNIA